jgi:hypothetical protein
VSAWRWAIAVDRGEQGSPAIQAAVLGRLAAGVALGLRSEPQTGSVGLTTAWRWRAWLIRSAHLSHPELGTTHRWGLAWGRLELIW